MLVYFFAGLFLISPVYEQTQGSWCCVFLMSRITLMVYQQSPETLRIRPVLGMLLVSKTGSQSCILWSLTLTYQIDIHILMLIWTYNFANITSLAITYKFRKEIQTFVI
jgi:hypothetical protein